MCWWVTTVSGRRRAVAWRRYWRDRLCGEACTSFPGVTDCVGAGEELNEDERGLDMANIGLGMWWKKGEEE